MAVVESSPEFVSHSDGGSGLGTFNPLDRGFSVGSGGSYPWAYSSVGRYSPGHRVSNAMAQYSGYQRMVDRNPPTSLDQLVDFEKHKSPPDSGSGFVTSNLFNQRFSIPSGNSGAIQASNPLHLVFGQNQETPLSHQQSTSWGQQSWDQQMADMNSRWSSDQLTEFEKQNSLWNPSYVNHKEEDLIKQFETQFKVYEKVAVMKEVEETRERQTVSWERRLIPESKTVIVHDEVERTELVPVVKDRINMKPEFYYHVVEEEIEVPVTEQVLSYEENRVTRQEPRIVAEEVEEMFKVPVVKHVPRTRTKKIITEEYDDILVSEYENPGRHNNSDFSDQIGGHDSERDVLGRSIS